MRHGSMGFRRPLPSPSKEILTATQHYKRLIANKHDPAVALADTRNAMKHNPGLK